MSIVKNNISIFLHFINIHGFFTFFIKDIGVEFQVKQTSQVEAQGENENVINNCVVHMDCTCLVSLYRVYCMK